VGLTQTALLQKVEELTLYIINQDKEIEELKQQKNQLEQLQQEFEELKKSIKNNNTK
jgi:endonuclease/exonuclease/phosphatase (EEP) superfamily protein YafD